MRQDGVAGTGFTIPPKTTIKMEKICEARLFKILDTSQQDIDRSFWLKMGLLDENECLLTRVSLVHLTIWSSALKKETSVSREGELRA